MAIYGFKDAVTDEHVRLVEGVEAQAITGTTNGDKLNADLTISQGQTIAAEPESQWQAGFEARGQVATEFATSAGGTALMAIYGFKDAVTDEHVRLVEGVEAQAITGTTNGDKLNADLTISQGQTIAAEPESQWQAGFEARGQVATEFATSAGGTALMAIYGFKDAVTDEHVRLVEGVEAQAITGTTNGDKLNADLTISQGQTIAAEPESQWQAGFEARGQVATEFATSAGGTALMAIYGFKDAVTDEHVRLVEGVEAQAITGTTNGDKLNADLTISQGQTIAAEPESQWQAGFEARGQVATEFATSAGGTALMAIRV